MDDRRKKFIGRKGCTAEDVIRVLSGESEAMTVNFPAQQEEGLSSDEVNNILKAYDLGKAIGVSRLRSGYANENYKIDTDRDSYLLRVCWEKGEHDIRHETKVLERLKKDRFPAAYPIPRIDGDVHASHGTMIRNWCSTISSGGENLH